MIERNQVHAWGRGFVAAIFLPLIALSSPLPPQPDPDALRLDRELQKLKEDALDINGQAQRAQSEILYPDYSRVSVYLGVSTPGLLVKDVSVTIDDDAPVSYEFNGVESYVLQRQGLYRVLDANVSPGTHRIRAQFSGRYADAKDDVGGSYEAYFNKDLRSADLELFVGKDGRSLQLREWKSAR
jgi:hypothetical protein